MAEKLNPATAEEKDISKAQSAQQPETGEQRQPAELGQETADQPDQDLQGETLAQQRTDIEGATLNKPERAEEESGFIGTEGETDTSSELVDDEEESEEFRPDGE
jgi:hypothetical protein